MASQELARAFRVEQPGWRAVPRLDSKLCHGGFDHGIANEKLRNDLDIAGIDTPILENHASQERVLYEHHDSSRRAIRFPTRVEICGAEIDGPRIGPTLNQSTSLPLPYTMSTRCIEPQRSLGKRTGRFARRPIDHMPTEVPRCCRVNSLPREQIRKLGWQNEWSLQRRDLKQYRNSARFTLSQSRHFRQISRKNFAAPRQAVARRISESVQRGRPSLTLFRTGEQELDVMREAAFTPGMASIRQ
jgi:hypothetical protein